MKKAFVSVLIFFILFNFICVNCAYCNPTEGITQEEFDQMQNDGIVNIKDEEASINDFGISPMGTAIAILSKQVNIYPMIFQAIGTIFLESGGIIKENCTPQDLGLFSIQNIIIGKYLILDVDVFRNIKNDISDGKIDKLTYTDTIIEFKNNVAMWFIIIRDIAIAINLGMLLYIAIQMAVSTLAQDKARYKELLYNWVISMAILFLLPYIMSAINIISEMIVSIARNFMIGMEKSNNSSFENEILSSTFTLITENGGMRMALYSIIYWIIMWNEIKFFLLYIKRMLTAHFLVVISPLITVTYAADKIADRKAQAFDRWLKEYSTNVFVQPIHCFVYMVFMYMANNIAVRAPLVGVIFLMSLTRTEKIVKSLIAMSAVSLKGIGDGINAKRFSGSLRGLIPKGKK